MATLEGGAARVGLVSVAVGNTTTRAVWWATQQTIAKSAGSEDAGTSTRVPEQPLLLHAADTLSLREVESARTFVADLLRQMLQVEVVPSKGVAVAIGGGSVPAVEKVIHDAIVSKGDTFSSVLLVHQQQHDNGEIDEDRWRHALIQEVGLRVIPSPSWRVGKDRLCAALGALSLDPHTTASIPSLNREASMQLQENVPAAWIVVDSGTALTFNVVWPSPRSAWPEVGVFEGGLIMPGEGLMLRSLSSGTAQLPSLPYWPSSPPPLVGKSTEEAIRAGVRHLHLKGAISVVKSLICELEQRIRESPNYAPVRVVFTGGGGQNLAEALATEAHDHELRYDPFLVHRGLLTVWKMRLAKQGEATVINI